jgi:hypothetical protein
MCEELSLPMKDAKKIYFIDNFDYEGHNPLS